MKTGKFNVLIIMVATILMSFSYQLNAQKSGRGQGQRWNQQNNTKQKSNIPNLTEDQQKKIKVLKTAHLKEMMKFKNLLAENNAHLNTLRTADKADMSAINKTIDKMSANKAEMMKKREAHLQSVRQVLTDEQRILFDSRKGNAFKGSRGQGRGNGIPGQGRRRCQKF